MICIMCGICLIEWNGVDKRKGGYKFTEYNMNKTSTPNLFFFFLSNSLFMIYATLFTREKKILRKQEKVSCAFEMD